MLRKVKKFLKALGPGVVTGASDDDPSGIATYSQAGAKYGLATLWTVLITFPLMAAIQEICARIGLVTAVGLTTTLRKHYSKFVLYLMILFSIPAIILNIGADIAGMGAVAHLIFPAIHAIIFSILFTAILLFFIIYLPYSKFVSVLKYLCLTLLLYIIVPFFTKPDWGRIKSDIHPDDKMGQRLYRDAGCDPWNNDLALSLFLANGNGGRGCKGGQTPGDDQ